MALLFPDPWLLVRGPCDSGRGQGRYLPEKSRVQAALRPLGTRVQGRGLHVGPESKLFWKWPAKLCYCFSYFVT